MDVRGLPAVERLKLQLVVDEATGCWLWRGANGGKAAGNSGYGVFTLEGRSVSSHRAAWLLLRGPIGAGLCVLHHCDNRRCCNPDHLYLGDKKQNRKDFMQRHPKAQEIVARGIKAGAAGAKRFWDAMDETQKVAFVAKRAAAQAAKRRISE